MVTSGMGSSGIVFSYLFQNNTPRPLWRSLCFASYVFANEFYRSSELQLVLATDAIAEVDEYVGTTSEYTAVGMVRSIPRVPGFDHSSMFTVGADLEVRLDMTETWAFKAPGSLYRRYILANLRFKDNAAPGESKIAFMATGTRPLS